MSTEQVLADYAQLLTTVYGCQKSKLGPRFGPSSRISQKACVAATHAECCAPLGGYGCRVLANWHMLLTAGEGTVVTATGRSEWGRLADAATRITGKY